MNITAFKKFTLSLVFVFQAWSIFAQTGTVRGFVYDKETGEPALFSTVYLQSTTYGSTTDVNGFFAIAKIPIGNYVLMVTYLGYDTLRIPVTVGNNDIITKKLYLVKTSIALQAIEISADKQEAKTETRTSVTKITPKEIKQIPSIGGDADISQFLQIVPGVIFTGDQGGQLYIRGGSPVQNKVLLDGMVVYNPFHSIGFFSVFDTDIMRNVDVYTGGFGAEFGGRISSVMNIATRDGNKKRLTGKISASPFTSKLILEGPVSKAKEEGDGTSSFILSAKTSYLKQSSRFFYSYLDTLHLPYNFTDLYGKFSLNATNGSKLNVFGFNFSDKVNYQDVSDLKWSSNGFGADFIVIPGSSNVLLDGDFAYSKYFISLKEAEAKPRTSEINGFNMGLNFSYFLAGGDEVKYGVEALGFSTNFDFYNFAGHRITQEENTTELAGYVKYKKIWKKLLFEPSFRAHYYVFASASEMSPEPRIAVKQNITDKFRIKLAGGLYSQNLISANSDRDIVNLFYGFLSGSDNLPEYFDGNEISTKLQKAKHFVAGIEYDLPKHITLNVETYLKKFVQLTNINRDKIYEDNGDNYLKPDILKKDFIIETGDAEGVDFLVKYDYRRLYLWAVYSLGFVTRFDGTREYVPHFDRRHNVNLTFSYTFGKNFNWEVDARWNWGSGFPFTQTEGYYELITFTKGINTDYTVENGELGTLYGELNKGKLSDYHRLDITVKKKWEVFKNSTLEANITVINVYNRRNIFYKNRITGDKVYQLPVLPSFGISLTF